MIRLQVDPLAAHVGLLSPGDHRGIRPAAQRFDSGGKTAQAA